MYIFVYCSAPCEDPRPGDPVCGEELHDQSNLFDFSLSRAPCLHLLVP